MSFPISDDKKKTYKSLLSNKNYTTTEFTKKDLLKLKFENKKSKQEMINKKNKIEEEIKKIKLLENEKK